MAQHVTRTRKNVTRDRSTAPETHVQTLTGDFELKLLYEERALQAERLARLESNFAEQELKLSQIRKERDEADQYVIALEDRAVLAIREAAGAIRGTTAYQLGDALIAHLRKPWRLPFLPAVLARLYVRQRRAKRFPTHHTLELITQAMLDRSPRRGAEAIISIEDAAQSTDRKRLRQAFWDAYRKHEIRTCRVVYERLRELGENNPSEQEQRYLQKIVDKLSPEVVLLDNVELPKTPQIELKSKSVCYFLHNSLPYASGGYATRARGVVHGLMSRGFKVHVVTRPGFPLDQKRDLSASDVPLTEIIDGATYHRILEPQRSAYKNVDYMARAADAVEAFLRDVRPSVAIAASNYYTGLPVLIAARRLGIPFVYEVRGFWEVTRESREPAFKYTMPYKIQEFMEAELCRKADAVLTLTSAMKDELIRRGVPDEQINLLPNACDPGVFTPLERSFALLARLGIPQHVPVIGYIGSFVQYEGLDDLAAACAILKSRGVEFRLLIVGNENVVGTGLGPIAQSIVDRAKEGNFEDWVIMPGRVPHDEVPDYYSIVDIAAFPRKAQPVTEMVSPMKSLEAMSMSKAIVVSSVEALAEMVEHGRTGLVFAKSNIPDLADKLQLAATDLPLRKTLGVNAREWIIANRTWSSAGLQAEKVLTSISES